MKKSIFIIVLILISHLEISSQTGWVTYYIDTLSIYPYWSIDFVDQNTGYISGFEQIVKTSNGGINWFTVFSWPLKTYYSLDFVTPEIGFAGGYPGQITSTTNGGINWAIQFNGVGYIDIFMLNSTTGYATQNPNMEIHIRKTTNGGNNWNVITTLEGWAGDMHWVNELTGYLLISSQSDSKITKTTNGGVNWFVQTITYFPYHFYYMKFFNQLKGCALAVGNYIARYYQTTNGGSSWSIDTMTYPVGYGPDVFYAINTDTAWMYNYYWGSIVKTTNAGHNWTIQLEDSNSISKFFFLNNNTGWALGIGRVYKTTTSGEPIGIKQLNNEVPEYYTLFQNYPNPFNPVTKVRFSIPLNKGGNRSTTRLGEGLSVRLIVYDILGSEIAILINEKLQPGSYEVEWDAGKYASGIYFYTLITESFNQTKRMVLVK